MAIPDTYRAFRRTKGDYPLSITQTTEKVPQSLGPRDVLIRIRAVSLNFRDVAMLQEGRYPAPVEPEGIPASDCAAEVVAVGEQVTKFAVGDRVAPTFNVAHLEDNDDIGLAALGGDVEGVLREYAVFEEKVLVKLPAHLSWEEAATITCAGVTAWTALNSLKGVRDGSSALLQGTGGVSMFALLICVAAGIKPIITSSSDEKLEAIKKLSSSVEGINYKKHTDVAAEALRLTADKGVDFVINNTGAASLPSDLAALRKRHGTVSCVGFLEGLNADWDPSTLLLGLMFKAAKIQGIAVGSRNDFEALCTFLEQREVKLTSIIDRVFTFDESSEAFQYLYSGKHVGKVVIKL
ncbi:hypothetical protein BFW01_g6946 [Lasiodiplodia theobromae]|nr:hypothetical protein BFW01_g6946 [Lasiodiplodia theobromae]